MEGMARFLLQLDTPVRARLQHVCAGPAAGSGSKDARRMPTLVCCPWESQWAPPHMLQPFPGSTSSVVRVWCLSRVCRAQGGC